MRYLRSPCWARFAFEQLFRHPTGPAWLAAYTMGSAYAEFQESEKGSITPGKLADMVLLDQDIFSIPAEKIRDTKVLKTLVGGKLVWDASGGSPVEP